jgi:hypothetical protein
MSYQERASETYFIMGKTSIASCRWYMERLKRFSALSLRPMGGLSAPLTCARIAPVPGSHVCGAYERCAPHESDSCHSGHASARGGIGPRGATRQAHAAANAAIRVWWPRAKRRATPKGPTPKGQWGFPNGISAPRRPSRPAFWRVLPGTFRGAAARDRGFAAGRQVFGAPDMARQDFLAPCMVIASVRRGTGVWRTRCQTAGTEGKRACVGQQGQGDGGSPGKVAVPAREPRLSRCESPADAWDLLLATVSNVMGTWSNIFGFVMT